ncbi:hypothetical protein A1O7_01181 [Cladophialophora yegresii CBS 114405]|uniref:Uncharacterized protein n=1 Tax=Cladophialophora yegresii CBS 114405 TaxID=1182544 RepID=W9WA92_9EURO|nr:uncharacterized protein A1O7_01181 [Cladophialophora yegresii CBS 114405]EXJ64843.1 hypothetical protein A1O7_01181 [Cladophialophora yegresii CBS 114405]
MAKRADKNMIFQRMDQTGDTTHVVASLAIDPVNSVLILFNDQTKPQDVNLLKEYYVRATRDRDRVHALGMNGETNVEQLLMGDGRYMENWNGLLKPKPSEKPEENALRKALQQKPVLLPGENEFVDAIKNNNLTELYRDIASRTSGATEYKIAELFKDAQFAGQMLPAPSLKPVLLLCPRYSGFNKPGGGHNPEGDSDVRGQAQLIHLFEERFTIITVGHDPVNDRPGSPNNDDINSAHAKCHLGEFYLKDPLAGKGRGEQVSFLLALMKRYPGSLYQLGQKTGAMDAGALGGIPTLYIEHESSPTFKRMLPWVETIPFYRCAKINKPPTVQNSLSNFDKEALAFMRAGFKKLNEEGPAARSDLLNLGPEDQKTLTKIFKLKSLVAPVNAQPSLWEVFKVFDKVDVAGNTKMVEDLAAQWEDSNIIKGYNQKDRKIITQGMGDLVNEYTGKAVIIKPEGSYEYHWR